MTLQQAPYYWLTCDGTTTDGGTCGARSTEGGDSSAWSDPEGAWADAEGSEWLERDGKHYCDGCAYTLLCAECGDDTSKCAGHNAPETETPDV